MSPSDLLQDLIARNTQWAKSVQQLEGPDFFPDSAKGQAPKVLWIGCADSRVPESVIMGCRPGEIFVHRNIANQFHPDDDSALSVLHLRRREPRRRTHNCGGAAAALAASASPPSTPTTPLARWLAPLTALAASLRLSTAPPAEALNVVVEESVAAQVANVCASDIVTRAWAMHGADPSKRQRVEVHGWVYDLATGRLRDLGVSQGPKKF